MSERHATLAQLAVARKQCRLCEGLTNPSALDGGALDSDLIGPYTRWQGNVESSLVVVGQDFADVKSFRKCGGWPGERIQTNLNLVRLVAYAGVTIAPPKRGLSDDVLFFTNAVLCLKQGNRQATIPGAYFRNCATRFTRPTIEAIRPPAVATLGGAAWKAVANAFAIVDRRPLLELLEAQVSFPLPYGGRLYPMAHPSPTVMNTTRPFALQARDWRRLGAWLRAA